MDWKEDLKLSIKRSVAKKGRRSSQQQQTVQDTTTSPQISSNTRNFSIPALVNAPSSSTSSPPQILAEKEDSMSIDLDVSIDSHHDQVKTPPKKATAGWADGGSKSGKNRSKNLFDEERFNGSSGNATTIVIQKEEDIPIIPDLDDIQDEMLMNEIVEPPSVTVNRVVTLQELDSDLLKQSNFSALDDVDLTILIKHLQPQKMLEEPDEVWEWDQVFTEISAEIHSETSATNKTEKTEEITSQIQYLS